MTIKKELQEVLAELNELKSKVKRLEKKYEELKALEEPMSWSRLPNELKIKIIEKCDFKTRIQVAKTCRLGNRLVKKAKALTWTLVTLDIHKDYMRIIGRTEGYVYWGRAGVEDEDRRTAIIDAFVYMLQSEVTTISIYNDCAPDFPFDNWAVDELREHSSFNFHMIEFNAHTKLVDFLLENRVPTSLTAFSYNDVKSTNEDIFNFIDKFDLSTCPMLGIHAVHTIVVELNPTPVESMPCNITEVTNRVVQQWIDKDVPIGTCMLTQARMFGSAPREFEASFLVNILMSTVKLDNSPFLIRGEDEEVKSVKHKPKTILIRYESSCYASLAVIPTHLPKSEYEEVMKRFELD